MSMLFDAVVHHRGPNHLLLACYVQRRRAFLELSIARAAELAGLQSSEWEALERGWIPESLPTLKAIAGTLESLWPEVYMVAEMTRYNQPKSA